MPSPLRILLFTDSRGELKKAFPDDPIYTERLEAHLIGLGHHVDLMLCPFKWTTTLDFIELVERGFIEPRDYDRVILHTGVVEWSPRNRSNLDEVLHGNDEPIAAERLHGRGRRPRFANDKLRFFQTFFGADAYDRHRHQQFDSTYRGEPTNNLVSLDLFEQRVIPHLKDRVGDDRLIFVNANRFVPGWDGNYLSVNPDGRPANIAVIEAFARRCRAHFTHVIDLLAWTDDEVKAYTVDNMHFTRAGSDRVFELLVERLD